MKFLIPLLSFFLGNAKNFFREPSQALTQQVALHIRAITILAVTAIGSLALSCVGLSLFISKIASQLDNSEEFHFTAGTWVYLAMTLVFAVLLTICLRQETWLRSVGLNKKENPKKGSPIENAIALLVMDFLEERKEQRQRGSQKEDY